MSSEINNKIGKATAWSSVTEVVARLITPVVNIILARILSPEAFGAVATITMIISFVEVFTDAGFQKYLVQHEFDDEKELNQSTNVAFWTNFLFSLAISCGICLFRAPLANIVGSPGLGDALAVSTLNIILVAFSSIQTARYRRDFDFKTLFFTRIGTAFIPLVVTVPLAMVLKNYWALVIGTLVSNAFNAVVLTAKSSWKPKFYYNFALLKEMFSFSMWTLIESISIWLTSYIDIFIVGSFLNEYYLGLYKTSMSTVNSYMGIITSATVPVLFSALSRYQNDDSMFRKQFFNFQRLTAVLLFPMGVGIFIFSDLVTDILLGSQWTEASGFIGMWGLSSAFTIVLSFYDSEVFRSKGNPKISLLSQVLHLAFLIPTLIVFVNYGFKELYIARSLIRYQGIVVSMLFMHFMYRFKVQDIFKNIFPPLLTTLIMGVVGFGLKQISTNIIWQFAVIFICIVVYFASLFLLFPKIRKEIFEMPIARKLFSKFRKE